MHHNKSETLKNRGDRGKNLIELLGWGESEGKVYTTRAPKQSPRGCRAGPKGGGGGKGKLSTAIKRLTLGRRKIRKKIKNRG